MQSLVCFCRLEDRRTVHSERINNNRNIVTILPGDLAIARTTFQRDNVNDKVAKLCYAVRSSSNIIRGTSHSTYVVCKLNKLDTPEFKSISEDFYTLQPSLKPCKHVDGSDTRYLNHYHAPIINHFKKLLNIELYDDKWFGTPPTTFYLPFKHDHVSLSFPSATTTSFPIVFPTFITI